MALSFLYLAFLQTMQILRLQRSDDHQRSVSVFDDVDGGQEVPA